MKGPPILVAAVLDQATSEMLRGLTLHENEYCHHVTMAYRPSPEVFAKYEHLIGRTIEFRIVNSFLDCNGQAATVNGVPSENAVPHITMGCSIGVQPSYSNKLLANQAARRTPLNLNGKATVEVIRL